MMICIYGSHEVGKSTIAFRITGREFDQLFEPTLDDSFQKRLNVDDEVCVVDVIDTSTIEYEPRYWAEYILSLSQGFIFVYSITSIESFDRIIELHQNILRIKKTNYFPLVLVGNKADTKEERQVSSKNGISLSKYLGCPFFEVSGLNGYNIEESLVQLIREVRKYTIKIKN